MATQARSRITRILRDLETQSIQRQPRSTRSALGGRDQYQIRTANGTEDRVTAWRLAYNAYCQKGYVTPNAQRLWYSIFDALPRTVTLLAERCRQAMGTVTIVPDSPLGLPADETFADLTDRMRTSGLRLAEAVSMVQAELSERAGMVVISKLCELTCLVARGILEATTLIITVNPRHERYYRDAMLFRRHGPVRDCGRVSGAPAVLLSLDLTSLARYVEDSGLAQTRRNIYRRFMPAGQAEDVIRHISRAVTPLDEAALRKYFVEERQLLPAMPPTARHHFEDCYPFYNLAPATSDTREYLPV
jgi:N-acyl amino acid synthase FeeM